MVCAKRYPGPCTAANGIQRTSSNIALTGLKEVGERLLEESSDDCSCCNDDELTRALFLYVYNLSYEILSSRDNRDRLRALDLKNRYCILNDVPYIYVFESMQYIRLMLEHRTLSRCLQ